MARLLIAVCVLGMFGIALAGCGSGSGLVEVKGKVLYKAQPVSGATVTFQPSAGPLGIAKTDANGQFTLTTGGRPGVAPGEYHVSVNKMSSGATDMTSMTPDDMRKMATSGGAKSASPKNELPEKYANPATSKLTATVGNDASKNVFEFSLQD
jgi:hypothetical protein